MHASAALLFTCFAAASLCSSSYAKPISARQIIIPPANTTIHSGPLIRFEQISEIVYCTGPVPYNTAQVAINPSVWGGGKYCGDGAYVWYNGQPYAATVNTLCTTCPDNGIGLLPEFYQQVTGETEGSVEGEWAVDGDSA